MMSSSRAVMTMWRSPVGHLHRDKRCRSHGDALRVVLVQVTSDEFDAESRNGHICPICVPGWFADRRRSA
jgi:hypothetical protein